MFFRFGAAIVLAVGISLAGTALQKQVLDLRRARSRQRYQLGVLEERHARLRLETQELGAPIRWIDSLQSGEFPVQIPDKPVEKDSTRMPLLRWQRRSQQE